MCRVGGEGKVGDCLRACVASVLDIDPDTMPHFFEDDCDGDTGIARLREWLAPLGYAPFMVPFDGSISLAELLQTQAVQNPAIPMLLFHRTESGGDHIVIVKDGEVVHNPAWARSPIAGPHSGGAWWLMAIARL